MSSLCCSVGEFWLLTSAAARPDPLLLVLSSGIQKEKCVKCSDSFGDTAFWKGLFLPHILITVQWLVYNVQKMGFKWPERSLQLSVLNSKLMSPLEHLLCLMVIRF